MTGMLQPILARTRREIARRRRRQHVWMRPAPEHKVTKDVVKQLRRPPGAALRVIAEVKFRSPSAGIIHPRTPGAAATIARGYEDAGASAISVLADGPSFGGGVLDVRRCAAAVSTPVLFKGFVLDEVQLDLARAVSADAVLLLVRCLPQPQLTTLVEGALARGLHPLVEAMNKEEVTRALDTKATLVGVNARDLDTFKVDLHRAWEALEKLPTDRVGIQMSGIHDRATLTAAGTGRADAVLIGEGLMRAPDPPARLRQLLNDG